MGRYQWQLWVLCGFGWVADQMLYTMLAIIQPRVQAEFNFDGSKVGGITAGFLAGLALGATFWGYGADVWGRKLAFNLTLSIAGIFGTLMGSMNGYAGLCGIAIAMGTAIGGNVPLDGAIYLETSPRVSQRVLTLMSIYWCLGQRSPSLEWSHCSLLKYCCVRVTPQIFLLENRREGGMLTRRQLGKNSVAPSYSRAGDTFALLWVGLLFSCGPVVSSYSSFMSPRKISSREDTKIWLLTLSTKLPVSIILTSASQSRISVTTLAE